MMEEIERWDKDGTISSNMGGTYEGEEIVWTDPEYKPNISNEKASAMVIKMFGIEDVPVSTNVSHTLNGYNRDDIATVGRDQILWGGSKPLYESDSEDEPDYDLY